MTQTPDTTPHAYVIGYPIKHSRSPQIHRFWLEKYNLVGTYDMAELKPDELEAFINNLRQPQNAGTNITIPYKQDVLKYLDGIDNDARDVGAVNTIYKEGDKLLGTNTDVYGFLMNLSQGAPSWQDTTKTVVIIGAGGAARAVLSAMKKSNIPRIYIANRTISRAQKLAEEIHDAAESISMAELDSILKTTDLVINTTSLGMTGQPPLDLNLSALPSHTIICDIVYSPLKTELLKRAEERGLATVEGLGMLLYQAVRGFELWFGVRPEVTPELRRMIEKSVEAG